MELLVSLLNSKKFVAFIIGLIMTVLGKYNIVIPEDVVTEIVSLTIAYILSVGLQDHGKEKAKIEKSS